MKVILSRKGFDSSAGGCASPLLPDGRLISLPIPVEDRGVRYSELHVDGWGSLRDLMEELGITSVRIGSMKKPVVDVKAHADPDLAPLALSRLPGWRALFGQTSAAAGHLRRQQVGPGDLFIFFGLFQRTERASAGRLCYSGGRLHVVYGYLEVEQVIDVSGNAEFGFPDWSLAHPHIAFRGLDVYQQRNIVYVAAERLTLDPKRPGGGIFTYSDRLRLTRLASSPSIWELPMAFHPSRTKKPLTYNPRDDQWSIEGDSLILRAAPRGQEFVVEANDGILDWLRGLFEFAETGEAAHHIG